MIDDTMIKIQTGGQTTVFVIDGHDSTSDDGTPRTPPTGHDAPRTPPAAPGRGHALTVAVLTPKPFDTDGLENDLHRNFGPVDIRIVEVWPPANTAPLTMQGWFDLTARRLATRVFAATDTFLRTYVLKSLPKRITMLKLDGNGYLAGDSVADAVVRPWEMMVYGPRRRDQLLKRIHDSLDELISRNPEPIENEN